MKNKYVIMDSNGQPIARCESPDGLNEPVWRLTLEQGDEAQLRKQEYIGLVGTSDKWAAAEGRIIRWKDDVIWVEAVRELGQKLRENLRMPATFHSFLYPRDDSFAGRIPIESLDLSCGGIAFYCDYPLREGQKAQVVIPVTAQPLLLNISVLRQLPSKRAESLYAARFTDMVREEESMVREAVFNLQLRQTSD